MHSNGLPSHPSGQAKTNGQAEASGRFDSIGHAEGETGPGQTQDRPDRGARIRRQLGRVTARGGRAG